MPLKPRIGLRELGDPGGLVEMLALVGIDLDEDELIDLHRLGGLDQMLGQHEPVELGRIPRPGIAEPPGVAEMHMAVDDREFYHGVFLTHMAAASDAAHAYGLRGIYHKGNRL